MFIASVMPSSHLTLWRLLLPSIFPSVRDFSSESSVHIRWPKDWSLSFIFSPSGEYSGLISLKIDWFDLLAVQGILRSLLQHHSSKAAIIWHSSFYMVQLSQQYMTTGKTIALTIWTFVGRVMSWLFNTLYKFVMAFLSRSNHLLISWLQLPSAVILEPKKRKSVTTSTSSSSLCHRVHWVHSFTELHKPLHHNKAVIHEGVYLIMVTSKIDYVFVCRDCFLFYQVYLPLHLIEKNLIQQQRMSVLRKEQFRCQQPF